MGGGEVLSSKQTVLEFFGLLEGPAVPKIPRMRMGRRLPPAHTLPHILSPSWLRHSLVIE